MNSKDQRHITRLMDQRVTRSCTVDRTKGCSETQAMEDDQKQSAKTLVTKKKRKVGLTRKQRHMKEMEKQQEMAKKVGLVHCHVDPDDHNEPWQCFFAPFEMYDLVCSSCKEFFDFIEPNKTTNIPDRCPLFDEEESLGKPAYCVLHHCIWNDTMNECLDCEEHRMMYNYDS